MSFIDEKGVTHNSGRTKAEIIAHLKTELTDLQAQVAEQINLEGRLGTAVSDIERLQQEKRDLQQTFDLRWKADMKAIQIWQEAHPGNDLVWPDHADLCVWLMEQLSEYKVENARLEKQFNETCDWNSELVSQHYELSKQINCRHDIEAMAGTLLTQENQRLRKGMQKVVGILNIDADLRYGSYNESSLIDAILKATETARGLLK